MVRLARTIRTSLLPIATLLIAAPLPSRAQLPSAPEPTLAPAAACPAVARFQYDVSSIDGADRVRWELRRGGPNQGFNGAAEVDQGVATGASGSVEKDLRQFGPVLDGTRYFFRVRARQGGTNVSDFSPPVRFDADLPANGMVSAIPGPAPATVRLDWNLNGGIGACADRVVVRIQRAGGGEAAEVAATGASGSRLHDLSASGPGEYELRLQARHGGNAADDDVGRQGAPVALAVAAPTLAIESFRLQNGAPNVNVTVPVTLDATIAGGTPTEYKAAPCGLGFTSAAFQPWPGSPPPVLPAFTTAGERTVCFQVRNTGSLSAVASDAIQVVAMHRFDPGAVTSLTGLGPLDLAPVTISNFQIRGGAPFVTVGRFASLGFTATGSPTEHRTLVVRQGSPPSCAQLLNDRPWQTLPGGTPQTARFDVEGRHYVCIQLRNGSRTSAAAVDDIGVVKTGWNSVILGPGGYGLGTLGCGDGFAVGVSVRKDWWIDALALRCAELTAEGDHRNVSTTEFLGGGGGQPQPQTLQCQNGMVLFGFNVIYGGDVHRLYVYCIPWTSDRGASGSSIPIGFVGGMSADGSALALCPQQLAVRSVEVFGGSYVSGIRIYCKPPRDM